jgi:O-antigen/teichoic acid export membrane protein
VSEPGVTVAGEPAGDAATESVDAAARPQLATATVTGLRWISIARTIVELMLMGSLVALARLIPPAAFGPYAVAAIVQALAIGIQEQGVGSALVQRRTVTRAHLQVGQAMSLLSGLVLAAICYLAGPTLVKPVFGTPTESLIELSAPLFVVYSLGITSTARLRRRLAFRSLAVIDVLNSFVRVSVSIALAVSGLGAKSMVIGALVAGFLASMAAWSCAPPPLPILHRRELRELLGYGLAASLASICWVCFANCDYVIVGARVGTLQAGLYFRAYNLAVEYQKKISSVMVSVAFPVLARTAGPGELDQLRRRMVRLLTLVLFPLLAVLAIVAPVLIPWLLGSDWSPAVVPTQILTAGGAVTLVMDTTGVVLMARGRSRAMLGFGLGHFVVYATAVWFVCRQGIWAVATAAAVVHTVFLFVSYATMLHGSEERVLPRLWGDIAPATVACAALAAVAVPATLALSGAHAPALLELPAVGAAAAATYLLVLRFAFRPAFAELCSGLGRIVPVGHLGRLWGRRPSLAAVRPLG